MPGKELSRASSAGLGRHQDALILTGWLFGGRAKTAKPAAPNSRAPAKYRRKEKRRLLVALRPQIARELIPLDNLHLLRRPLVNSQRAALHQRSQILGVEDKHLVVSWS